MNQCIYCKKNDIEFNREHVIPKAFGLFGAKTMVLKDSVCQNCNEDFGKEIDQVLSRDSFEGLLRAQILGPQKKKSESFKSRRVKIYFPDNETCGILRGAGLDMDWNTRSLRLLDQIIVRSKSGKLAYFYEQEFEREDASKILALPKGAVRVLGTNASKVEALMKLVYDKGVQIKEKQSITPPSELSGHSVPINLEGQIDGRVWRSIAKIVFNYLTFIQGDKFVLKDVFDPIRDFIRGKETTLSPIKLYNKPFLNHETFRFRSFEGHLLGFQRENNRLRGKISLFNTILYEVMLCEELSPIHYSLKSGHGFDPLEKKVLKMSDIPNEILRPVDSMRNFFFFPL